MSTLPILHRPRLASVRSADSKERAAQQFYKSNSWRRKSEQHRRNEPLCRLCAARSEVVLAQMVDHITPIKAGGALFDDANLQSLCNRCHGRKRQSEGVSQDR